eukprot:CAMPEP_0194162668 /NCGR_PEP_ID=MMETSP0152-20130528/79616_1 /TAXON_ID=1049557 /ORGANISM="Thalassiothrix antarctica, Strain L6-D1" /LENGTH=291 /DNA_ID=CAMNT_0038872579 /DNA_START=1061 /DNA_END=1933 /DNA_ORIENTATION=+
MTVVVVGPQSLDELQGWITSRFGKISFKELENPEGEVETLIKCAAQDMPAFVHGKQVPKYTPAFSSKLQNQQWPVLVTIKPLRSMRKSTLNFPMPPTRHMLRRSPTHLISHLLGHEGSGSSFSLLQTAGLLSSLSAGCRIIAPDQTVFQLNLGLTEQGEKEWKMVVALLLEHCRLISEEKDLQRHWDESRILSEIQFNNSSPKQAYSFAPTLAQLVVSRGTKLSLSADGLMEKKIPIIDDVVSCLTPENCFIERCSEGAWNNMEAAKHFASGFGKKTEKWYNIDYYLSVVD